MKKIITPFLLLFCIVAIQAQNKKILYGFDAIPQGLLVNPGQENPYKSHIGIPVLSGLHIDANISGITVADLFKDDGIGTFSGTNFNTKFENALNNIGDKDYISANAQVEVLSGGLKLNGRDYLSVGFYTEADLFIGFPKDVLDLIYEGNGGDNIGRIFSAEGIAARAEVLGVLHAGITRRINNRLTLGTRLKIYSGSINVTTNNNQGTFLTTQDRDGIYDHRFNNIDAEINSSGIYEEDNDIDLSVGSVLGSTFLSKNIGLGVDLGFTFHATEQLEFTASLLDIGFVSYSKKIRSGSYSGSFNYSGIDFQYTGGATNYYGDLEDEFNESIVNEEDRESYSVLRPVKFNSSIRYSFGKSRYLANCHDIRKKDFFDNAVGGQLYAIKRPYGVRMAFTGFYERKFAKFLNTKVTWTADDFSSTNFGLGISTNIWKLNVYGLVDNVFKLGDITDANTVSAQFGINLIFN